MAEQAHNAGGDAAPEDVPAPDVPMLEGPHEYAGQWGHWPGAGSPSTPTTSSWTPARSPDFFTQYEQFLGLTPSPSYHLYTEEHGGPSYTCYDDDHLSSGFAGFGDVPSQFTFPETGTSTPTQDEYMPDEEVLGRGQRLIRSSTAFSSASHIRDPNVPRPHR